MGKIGGEWTRLEGFNYTPALVTNTICQVAIVYGFDPAYIKIEAASAGKFYAVMVPAASAEDALQIQKKLIDAGYTDTACVNI